MISRSRRIPRTDRPGSGAYIGPTKEGLAFDDYRSSDEHDARHRRERPTLLGRIRQWAGFATSERANSENLLAEAAKRIAHDPTVETSKIKISAQGGELRISGSVTSHWMKKRVSELLGDFPGKVTNELTIRPEHNRLPQEGALSPRKNSLPGE